MSRRIGIKPSTALEQASKVHDTESYAFEPLPSPPGVAPYRITTAALDIPPVINTFDNQVSRTFHVIGDHGGVSDPNPQKAVVNAMIADVIGVDFCYSVGDLVYFNGAGSEYIPQFFEAYSLYRKLIVGIPGNHDGDPEEDGEASLQAFVKYLCDQQGPRLLPEIAEYNRDTVELPNVYWTLNDTACTIIGLYTNVPEGGKVEADQVSWLHSELESAPKGVPLIIALHHPPYSSDAFHGGSANMGTMLTEAFTETKRSADLVMSGHVHSFQYFERIFEGKKIPYVVCGASGYHNRHAMAAGAKPGLQVDSETTLKAFEANNWGFLRLTVGTEGIQGVYTTVPLQGQTAKTPVFSYPFVPSE